MTIVKWRPRSEVARAPFRDLARIDREMEEAFGRFFRDWGWPAWGDNRRAPAIDMVERPDEVVLRVDLPGLGTVS